MLVEVKFLKNLLLRLCDILAHLVLIILEFWVVFTVSSFVGNPVLERLFE